MSLATCLFERPDSTAGRLTPCTVWQLAAFYNRGQATPQTQDDYAQLASPPGASSPHCCLPSIYVCLGDVSAGIRATGRHGGHAELRGSDSACDRARPPGRGGGARETEGPPRTGR